MTLNYDFVFLALTRYALEPCPVKFKARRCLAHPFKKRDNMERNVILDYCSGASAILNYQKLMDDLHDEKGVKKLRAILLRPFIAHSRKKALKKDPTLKELDKKVALKLSELAKIESSDQIGVDVPAACFGDILGEIMAHGYDGMNRRIAFELGRHVGAWIYVADALDDFTLMKILSRIEGDSSKLKTTGGECILETLSKFFNSAEGILSELKNSKTIAKLEAMKLILERDHFVSFWN